MNVDVTGLQIFGTILVLVLGLIPPVLVIVFRHRVVDINRRKAERLADRYKGPIGALYRLTGDGQNATMFVTAAIIWAAMWITTIVGGTLRALG